MSLGQDRNRAGRLQNRVEIGAVRRADQSWESYKWQQHHRYLTYPHFGFSSFSQVHITSYIFLARLQIDLFRQRGLTSSKETNVFLPRGDLPQDPAYTPLA